MATLVLQYAGAALGGLFGGPLGAIIGRAAGAIAGGLIDAELFGAPSRRVEGPRLQDLRVMGSTEGSAIPRVWGRMRVSGQVIWATQFEEVISTQTEGGSKGAGGGPETEITEYSYFANFAVALAEGPIARIGRVWADGKEFDLSGMTWRFYPGSEDQEADSLISAKEGSDEAPAYRGTSYAVFERLPLERFGNRLPQLSFEIFQPIDGFGSHIKAVNIIPGSTEFGYDPMAVNRDAGEGVTAPENTHIAAEKSDWTISIDDLTAAAPQLEAASLVVAWFGPDLRCGMCEVKPGVERRDKVTRPEAWKAAGLTRDEAHLVSEHDGHPAYGGTPSDRSVLRAIADLNERGLRVVLYPFILMDIPAGNPQGQPAYPWRGRVSCDPPPGEPGSPDKTALVIDEIDAFVGSAEPADFGVAEGAVTYSGPAEWSLRRMVLHYAKLCALAGGVDAFLIGSELRGLTALRSGASTYPFVEALRALAADVAAILPDAKISYAVDWSEYSGHRPDDGSNDRFFHLDRLWASPDIDFIGIDNYLPLTDWRDGTQHLDRLGGVRLRLESIADGLGRRITARSHDAGIYVAPEAPARRASLPVPPVFGPPVVEIADLPVTGTGIEAHAPWIAACAQPWPGELAVLKRESEAAYSLNRWIGAPAVMGELVDPLPAGTLWRYDRTSRLRVRLYSGTLQSVSDGALLAGANAAAIGGAGEGWEIIQFRDAALTAAKTYEISWLLRGQSGSEPETIAARSAGSRFVLLNPSAVQLDVPLAAVGRDETWRIGPSNRDHGDPSYVEVGHAANGIGLRPLSPVHLRGPREAGDILFTWMRRTRIDGDGWELSDVPLGEEREAYEIEIVSAGDVVRKAATAEAIFRYTAAAQAEDFGASVPASLTLRVYQMSNTFGRGAPLERTLHV